ncbi:MAG: hypothetical protein HY323_07155 [Betaproteobacteria bacterium]|nr:hypothetical protein [Betaproteobacteria bacterium]
MTNFPDGAVGGIAVLTEKPRVGRVAFGPGPRVDRQADDLIEQCKDIARAGAELAVGAFPRECALSPAAARAQQAALVAVVARRVERLLAEHHALECAMEALASHARHYTPTGERRD